MKIDLTVRSAVFDDVFRRSQDAGEEAVSYRQLKQEWAAVRLRESDLAEVIEHLGLQGRLYLDSRNDGLWLSCNNPDHPRGNTLDRIRRSWRALQLGKALARIRERGETFYAGMDRRLGA